MTVRSGFTPIHLDSYVEQHLRANPGTNRAQLASQFEYAINACKRGVRCQCGAPIWIVGSAQAGLACFSCITGEATPDDDYEIIVSP